ncbi:MAG TPA: PaaI family thioesterase [Sporichthyaceae bacterium]|nr:PaaI family thioesterase [Sporichthyaceae bacterium]
MSDPTPARIRTYGWSDPQDTAAGATGRSGLDFIRALIAGELPPPPIAATMDFTITEADKGHVVVTSRVQEWQYNPIGTVHGGVYATLLDSAAGLAMQTTLPPGTRWTTLDLNVKFLRGMSADSGTVRTIGSITHQGRRTSLAEARMYDEQDRLLATATSSLLILAD